MSETPPPRTAAALAARRHNTQNKLDQVRVALTRLRRENSAITFPAIARRATVSRTFLYENAEARALVEQALTRATASHAQARTEHDTAQEAAWRERALNAEDALKAAHAEIRTQRSRIGTLIGNLRDLEQNHPHQSVEHLTAENTTLKHRVISSPRTTASWRNGSTPPAQTSASKTADSPTSKPSCSTMPTINNTTSGPIRYPRHLHARDAKSQLRDITDITTAGKLECNPGEQFGWLEARTGAPVTEALADLLAAGAS